MKLTRGYRLLCRDSLEIAYLTHPVGVPVSRVVAASRLAEPRALLPSCRNCCASEIIGHCVNGCEQLQKICSDPVIGALIRSEVDGRRSLASSGLLQVDERYTLAALGPRSSALAPAACSHRPCRCRARVSRQRRTSGLAPPTPYASDLTSCRFGAEIWCGLITYLRGDPWSVARDGQQGAAPCCLLPPLSSSPESCRSTLSPTEPWVAPLNVDSASPFTLPQPCHAYDGLSTDPSTPRPPGPVLCGPECGRGLFPSAA